MINKRTVWITLAPLVLLIIPLIGINVSEGWQWTGFDFVLMGAVLAAFGFAFAFISGKGSGLAYRAAVAIAAIASFLLVWVNMAVGIISDEDHPINLLFFIVPLVGLAGAFIAGFRAQGMVRAALAMAIAVLLAPVIAIVATDIAFDPGILRTFGLTSFFAMLYIVSGLLFKHSATKTQG